MPTYDYGYINEPPQITQLKQIYRSYYEKFSLENKLSHLKPFPQLALEKLGMARITNLIDGVEIKRWANVKEFKPSKEQVIRYLKWKMKTLSNSPNKEDRKLAKEYYIPLTLKEKKETTGKKEIEALIDATGDELLTKITEYRSVKKMIDNDLKNWKPGEDGKVHAKLKFTAPSGQLNATNPNILNCAKHTETGQLFRRIVEAPVGRCFIEFDKSAFHVAMMGFCAGDKSYIKFSQHNPHSIFTSWTLEDYPDIDLNWSDDEIDLAVKELNSDISPKGRKWVRDNICKHTVLGNQLGLGPRKLQRMNRRNITSIKQAISLQEKLKERFPLVEQFKEYITKKADKETILINNFGFLQEFWDVLHPTYDKRNSCWIEGHGSDYERAIAFLVQSNSFGMMKYEHWKLENKGLLERYCYCNNIHDSNIFMPEIGDRDRCIEDVYGVMSDFCSLLVNKATDEKGLRVGVEVSVGRNWQKFDKDKNPEGMREIKI